jgi:hypothetical protein
MIEFTIRVPEAVAQEIKMLAEKLAGMVEGGNDEWLDSDDFNVFFKKAIDELWRDRVIKRPRDYGWIMAALDQGLVADIEPFASPSKFREYLKILGVQPVPSKTTIASAYNHVVGDFPDWAFLDEPDATEVLRRKNVVNRFRSAFMRAKRAKLTANLDKQP